MNTYKELLAQRDALEKQIQEVRKSEISSAIAKIQEICNEFNITAHDIFKNKTMRKNTSNKVAAKYMNPETGETWTGRGKAPKWIAGQEREKFLIKP